jgi:hypothetical protein
MNLLAAQPKSLRDASPSLGQLHLLGFIGANLDLAALFLWLCPLAAAVLPEAMAVRVVLGLACFIAGTLLMAVAAQKIARRRSE